MAKPLLKSKLAAVETLLGELAHIDGLIAENTDAAAEALEQFKARHQPFMHKPVEAKVEQLMLTIASVRGKYDEQGIDDKKLVAYFEKEEKYDEAAQVLLAKARHFFMRGNLGEGEKILNYMQQHLLAHISPKVEIVYLTRIAFLRSRRKEYDEQMNVSLQALAKLKALGEHTIWHNNLYTLFSMNIVHTYLASSEFDKAWPYLEESLEIADGGNISTYNKFNVYSICAFYYEEKKDRWVSAAWHEKIINMLKGDATHQHYSYQSYFSAIIQYAHLLGEIPLAERQQRQALIKKLDGFVHEVSGFLQPDLLNGHYLGLQYSIARLECQKGNYEKAAEYLNICFPQYLKNKHLKSVTECYQLSHQIHYAWGKQAKDPEKLVKAYEAQKKWSEMVEEEAFLTTSQKLENVQTKNNLLQKELNEKLLQQQVQAMNKEIQLTALNLHEKILLLDELKIYVHSLKKKEFEKRQFIQAISQKIGAIKITEQDKAVLQQKINEGNTGLFKTLADKYPTLSTHEVRTCGLLKTGMSNKELSKLYGLSEKGYEQLRYRIKKKMRLTRDENLVKHLVGMG